jgi:predicted permease
MGALREAFHRVLSFFHKPQRDSDLDAELQSHIDLAVEENISRGMSPEEARRRALIRFGGVQQAKEHQREARGLPWLDILLQDLRYTLRTLRRDRAFTLVALLILALGIGANIAVFSVVNTVLLRPLPFQNPQQLVRIPTKDPKGGESSMTYSADATQEFQQRNQSFQDVTGYFAFSSSANYKLMGQGQPLPVTGLLVMGNFFKTLSVQPFLGRTFTPEECVKNSRPVALLSYAFWKRQFAGKPEIVGQAVNLNGSPTTVIGVLPETFDFGSVFSPGAKVDLYTPVIMDDIREWGNTLALVARLKPGVSLPQAQAEADLLFPKLDFNVKHPEYGGGYTANLFELKDYVSGKLRRSLIVLWCAVGMILLIVCVNLSNLLLARAAARNREFALRGALGAGRGRLVRQLLTESLVLSGAGALLGLGLAFAITAYLSHQGSIALPLLSSVRVDGIALAWTLLIAVTTAVLFGLTPALKMSATNLQNALKDGGQGAGEGRSHDRIRSALVVSEVALACLLLVGAGLLLRSFLQVLDVDLGFQPARTASISADYDDGNNPDKRAAIWQQMIRRVEQIPGIETAGITDNLPMSRNRSWGISAKGKRYSKGELQATLVYIISPGYLNTIGMHLVKGRDFTWDDGPKTQPVVLINETVARKLWPGEDPVGRIASVNGSDALVIGVVADVHETNAEEGAGWQMYLPATQRGPDGAQLVVRTKLPPETLAASVMSMLRQMNPAQPSTEFRPIQQLVDHAVSPRRFFVILVSVFALLGLFLAALGIYGVISYSVTQRTQEIGIRMALGATLSRIQLDVIRRTLQLALIGIAIGTVASFGASRLIASLLFGTTPTDPLTFLGMVLVLGAIALLAGYIPARRASRINPMVALRNS